MNARSLVLTAFALSMSALAAEESQTVVTVLPRTALPLSSALLEHEKLPVSFKLINVPGVPTYSVTVRHSELGDALAPTLSGQPFQLVLGWNSAIETLYVLLGTLSPAVIEIVADGPMEVAKFDATTMDALEAMPSDINSTLAKFLRARRFHQVWHVKGPRHQLTLRAARAWFDATTSLVTRRPSVFRLDPELERFLSQYNDWAVDDSAFAQRYRKAFPPSVVASARAQMLAAPYKAIGEIPKLLQARDDELALSINTLALEALQQADAETRGIVVAAQGVNVEMLEANAALISSRRLK